MKFFTYDYKRWNEFLWPYLIVKLQNYLTHPKKERYREILIDPGVYDLVESKYYSWEGSIRIRDFLNSLPKNHYFSCDYPGDMNPKYQQWFLEKSWNNAVYYCEHPQYIVTVQYEYNNFMSFMEWFDKYNELHVTSNIMGIGNLCKQRGVNEFVKHALPYAFKNSKCDRIHIYGPNMRMIKYISKLERFFKKNVSVDNRKWEFYIKSSERPQAFKDYMKKLEEWIQ